MVLATARVKAIRNRAFSCSACRRYIREGATVYVEDGRLRCELCGCPDEDARITNLDTVTVCKRIKAALRSRSGKDWSVTKGRGTAGGWIRIDAPKARLSCDMWHRWDGEICADCHTSRNAPYFWADELACPKHVCTETCYRASISPADRAELAALLGIERVHPQGVQIASSNDYYVEYIDRAEGREPRAIGTPYWD